MPNTNTLPNPSQPAQDKAGSSQVRPDELVFIQRWISQITSPTVATESDAARHSSDLPFSFQLGDRSSRDWLDLAHARIETRDWADRRRVHLLSWTDAVTQLTCEVEFTEFQSYPIMEWLIRLRNDGTTETPRVSQFKSLDIYWNCAQPTDMPELRRSLGSDGRYDDFQYLCDELRQSVWSVPHTIRMNSAVNNAFRKVRDGSPPGLEGDGRPSATWLPFFNFRTGQDGLIGAVGWSGQWFAEFAHDGKGHTDICAGMEHLDTKLLPGEEIRSPRMLLQYWQGETIHAQNVFRRFVLEFHSPYIDGQIAEMPICCASWGGAPTAGHLELIQGVKDHKLPYDIYWIDAGWYGTSTKPCPNVFEGEWSIVGDWRLNRNYHPDGLSPIREAIRDAGLKFLLWVEPCRALYGVPITVEHPEWFLRKITGERKHHEELLLDLGNPEAWQWAVELISGLITEHGLDYYREDFNIDPSPFWRLADEEGRKGISEMRFVEGFYAFWDELRRRHPKLTIDNCASGGRRLDLETIGRSIALWRTDYSTWLNPDASQLQSHGLNLWLPLNSISPCAKPNDTYHARSGLNAGMILNIDEFGLRDWKANDFPWEWLRARITEAKELRPYFYGDFYPLTPCVLQPDAWATYQLHLPAEDKGAVVAFRRSENRMPLAHYQLRDIDPAGTYEITNHDTAATQRATGAELMITGLAISTQASRESQIIFYRKVS